MCDLKQPIQPLCASISRMGIIIPMTVRKAGKWKSIINDSSDADDRMMRRKKGKEAKKGTGGEARE